MHDPGHSSRGSGAAVVVVTGGGVGRLVGAGRGLGVASALVLSQQTDPRLQLAVFDINTDGRSQNAAIMFSKQKPGHLGAATCCITKRICLY